MKATKDDTLSSTLQGINKNLRKGTLGLETEESFLTPEILLIWNPVSKQASKI